MVAQVSRVPLWVRVSCGVTPRGDNGCCDTRGGSAQGQETINHGMETSQEAETVAQSDEGHVKKPTCASSPLTAFPRSV